MPDTTDLGGENADGPVNLVPLDQAPGLLLQMISRFAMGLSEPMVL